MAKTVKKSSPTCRPLAAVRAQKPWAKNLPPAPVRKIKIVPISKIRAKYKVDRRYKVPQPEKNRTVQLDGVRHLTDAVTTVNGSMFAENPKQSIDFLKNASCAEKTGRSVNPKNGDITNVIIKTGISGFTIGRAR